MDKKDVLQAIYESDNLLRLIAKLKAGGVAPSVYNWAMRMHLDKHAREASVPLKGIFELTPLCNFDCKMCYVHLERAQMKNKSIFRADTWEKIMLEAIEAGMMYATLTGGECLTHPDFERLYLFLQEHSVQVAVLTNAYLLDEERIEFFKKHPPVSVQITLYGANEDMYERVTGKRAFEKVINNIKCAIDAHLPVSLTVTPNSYLTTQEIHNIIKSAAAFGVKFNVNSTLFTPRDSTERASEFKDLGIEDYISFFKLQAALKGEVLDTDCVIDLPPTGSTTVAQAPKGLRCGGGRSSFAINWEGKMTPCNRLSHISAAPLEEGFKAAWQSINKQATEYLLPIECETCAYRAASKNCAAAHIGTKPGHAHPDECKWCREMVRHSFAKIIQSN